ncbi:hypothetical protein HanRHA438_Chr10g0472431 [Helianthus annuus]|nr:hypothetical protein HanRHA438_Chr10g0472431 [Helianthus annuus]
MMAHHKTRFTSTSCTTSCFPFKPPITLTTLSSITVCSKFTNGRKRKEIKRK